MISPTGVVEAAMLMGYGTLIKSYTLVALGSLFGGMAVSYTPDYINKINVCKLSGVLIGVIVDIRTGTDRVAAYQLIINEPPKEA